MDAKELQRRVENLTVLLDVSREIGATVELEPLMLRLEAATLQILDCERATVFVYDRERNELYSRFATGVKELRLPADRGISGEALRTGKVINVPDAYADSRFNPDVDKSTGFRTRNMLTFAMYGYDGEIMGVSQALNKRDGAFTEEDEQLAAGISSLAGVALQRQLLLDQYAVKQRMQRDLDIAREIQQLFLPKVTPEVEGYDIAGWNKPADETGGDAYDFGRRPDGSVGLMIADATGHGIGPALVVAECRASIRAMAAAVRDLPRVVAQTNALLCSDLRGGRFVTVFCGVLHPARHTIEYVSAGHGPLLHYRAAADEFCQFSATTIPMGIVPDLDAAPADPVHLEPGDLFLLITDGFFEWANRDGEQFGLDRLRDVIREHRSASACDIIAHMHRAVRDYSGGTHQADDLTAIVIKRL